LVEDLRLRRVEVFRLGIAQGASTKADDVAIAVPNREHKAATEPVVVTTAVTLAGESCGGNLLGGVVATRHEVKERVPAINSVAKLPGLHGFGGKPTILQHFPARCALRCVHENVVEPHGGKF